MVSCCWIGILVWKSFYYVLVVWKIYELKVGIVVGKENVGNLLGLIMYFSFCWFLLYFVLGRGLRISGYEINCFVWLLWVVLLMFVN